MAAVIGTGMLARSIDYENGLVKHGAWLLHCGFKTFYDLIFKILGTLGAVLAPLCVIGGPVLMRAAWYTAGLVAGKNKQFIVLGEL